MVTVNMKGTGDNIARLIRKNHLTVRDIQEMFGFSQPTAVYKWIHGNTMPTIDNMVILADIFKCRIDDILVIDR